MLKTAGGYLLVLHTFEETETSSEQCVRLLQRAKEVGDWDLCKELARFLMALDESGDTLRLSLERMELSPRDTFESGSVRLRTPQPGNGVSEGHSKMNGGVSPVSSDAQSPGVGLGIEAGQVDYFSRR